MYMKVSIIMDSAMDKESMKHKMEKLMREILFKIRRMGMVSLPCLVVRFTRDTSN